LGPLIDAPSLARRLAEVAVLDVRWRLGGPSTYPDFLAGHIPGARWADLAADFADPPGAGGRHPLPDPARLEDWLRELGIDDDSAVVVYDEADSTASARAWWVLRWVGLRDVAVLDGGLAAWRAGGHPLEAGRRASVRRPGTVTARPGAMPALDAAGAAELSRDGVLLDARVGPRYRGETEPVDPVAGHIPGAQNAPTAANVGRDGRFLSPPQLLERFAAFDVKPGSAVGAYCGSGVTAAHTVLALALAGIPAALYPGSWSEWITDPGRAVATGPAPG
jgi:thiosulfate/3-mercaptopyruvate sulfurtransferase